MEVEQIDRYVNLTSDHEAQIGYHYDDDTGEEIEYRLTDAGIRHLADLQELEYLFIPGFLLSRTSVETLASLPRLQHLHAPFSVVGPSVLADIAAMQELRTLSIGVMRTTTLSLDVLQQLENLEVLQLFVFGDQFFEDESAKEKLKVDLQQMLPNVEMHIVPLRENGF